VFVLKGTKALHSSYTMQRRKDIYGEDAEEFRPERWGEETVRAWAYLPFNGGPRVCLGQQYALTEAAFTVARILQRYGKIEAVDPEEPVRLVANSTISPASCRVRLYRM